MVWTAEHTGSILDHVAEDRRHAVRHLIGFRGLRRGAACGQRWTDTHLDDRRSTVAKQLVVSGWEVYEDDPNTVAGARTIAFDSARPEPSSGTASSTTRTARSGAGPRWRPDAPSPRRSGEMFHLADVTRRFIELYEKINLPPIRLHDLSHGAATVARAAGARVGEHPTDARPPLDRNHCGHLHELAAGDRPGNRRGRRPPPGTEAEAVAEGTGESTAERSSGFPSAHAPRTQTAPDEESEAE